MNPGFVSFSRFARLSVTLILFSTAACGSDDSAGANHPSASAKVSADSQTVAAGVKMSEPLVVLVTGNGGTPIAGTVVEWLIGNGGGSLSDSVSTTDANGRAKTT